MEHDEVARLLRNGIPVEEIAARLAGERIATLQQVHARRTAETHELMAAAVRFREFAGRMAERIDSAEGAGQLNSASNALKAFIAAYGECIDLVDRDLAALPVDLTMPALATGDDQRNQLLASAAKALGDVTEQIDTRLRLIQPGA